MSNIELWSKAESGDLTVGSIFEDQEGNQIIFTGKSFQIYYTELENRYVGLCVGDIWDFVGLEDLKNFNE